MRFKTRPCQASWKDERSGTDSLNSESLTPVWDGEYHQSARGVRFPELFVEGAGAPEKRTRGDISMEQAKAGYDWKYWGWWVLANILGWGACASSTIFVTGLVDGRNGELWMILSAFLIGLAQWLVLARRFSLSGWLIPAYGLGWYTGLWLGMNLGFLTPEPFSMGAAGGALVGVIQWLGMRRGLHRSLIWIPTMIATSLLGCWLGVMAGVSAYNTASVGRVAAYAIGGAVAGAVIGMLSGFILITLIRQDTRRKAGTAARAST